MKKAVLILTFLASAFCVAQQSGTVTINWSDALEYRFSDHVVRIPHFEPKNTVYNDGTKSLLFAMSVPQSAAADPGSLQVSNLVYASLPASQLGDLKPANIPTSFKASLKSKAARDKYYAVITVTPIIKEGGAFKKLVSFSYSFNSGNARRVQALQLPNQLVNSVLATGDWYRFYVEKSGVYKISKSFLQSLGMNTNVDPRKLKIFGNGGQMLPLRNSETPSYDLEENAIEVIGETDGHFDSGDYILFYAQGVDQWNEDSQTHVNQFSDRSYYYVTVKGDNGKRIQEAAQPSTPTVNFTDFEDYQYHEVDETNIVRLGRRWFGEAFNIDAEQEFKFQFPGVVTSAPANISILAASAAYNATSFDVASNGQSVGTINLSGIAAEGDPRATDASISTSLPAAEDMTIKLTFNNNGVPSAVAYLDYIILKARRTLKGYNKQYAFTADNSSASGVAQYQFSNAASIPEVWDVTDLFNATKATNASQSAFSFNAALGDIRKYVVLDNSDYYSPKKESKSKVANQDIKGTIFKNQQGAFQDVDYVIVTPASLSNAAEKLAAFHRSYSNLNVKVVTAESIYQEFSSGKQDVAAIRNLMRYVYWNASSADKRVKYLCLMGDASFDFKNRIPNNTNLLPTYHALNSYNTSESSFVTDDFFGMMDDDEGKLDGNGQLLDLGGIDIAMGRIIAADATQADELVTKVIDYHDLKSYGSWRNNYVLISDDADKSGDVELQQRQNQLANAIAAEKPFLNLEKIYTDSYEQETAAGGARYPKARTDIFNAFEKGALVFNYLGHGGEDGLSGERIWIKEDGQNLSNRYRYPLFITITCEFSRFDNPYRPTAGEYTFWNPKGGAISMITTVRSIGQSSAQDFNDTLSEYLLSYVNGNSTNTYYSIAEALRQAKSASIGIAFNTNIITYLGDPALMLAIPKPQVRLTKVNDAPITGPVDDLQSLAYVKISGDVTDEFGTPLPNYNGELSVNVFDKNIQKTTLNNDNMGSIMTFDSLGETIFRGNATVSNGQFEFGFVVPRDIRIPVGNGRISFYAKRNQILLDKTGYNTDIKVGGINPNAAADNIGPTVKLYMNDQTFVNGGITNESPFFLAYLEDENGINTASGIGHDITAILDGDEANPYILNDYYEAETDNYKKGSLRFPFRNLAKGLHTITFKAWDVYNNPITAEIQFIVVGDDKITLTNVLNYPNPFTTYTQFWFSHNKPYEPLDVQVQVMTVTGKVVWTKNQVVNTDGFLSREVTWDGKDDFGDRIGKGVYIYKLTVRSTLTNTKSEKIEKLVIL